MSALPTGIAHQNVQPSQLMDGAFDQVFAKRLLLQVSCNTEAPG